MSWAIEEKDFSQRRACALIGLAPKVYRYRRRSDDGVLRTRLKAGHGRGQIVLNVGNHARQIQLESPRAWPHQRQRTSGFSMKAGDAPADYLCPTDDDGLSRPFAGSRR